MQPPVSVAGAASRRYRFNGVDDNDEYTNTDRLQCDGRTPICGTCESVGAPCTPSDRLVIRQIQPDSERDMLHNQLKSLQQQHNSLLLRFEQLQAEIGQGEAQTVPDVPLPGPLPTPNESLPGRQTLNLDISYSGRILQPTFTRRRDANNMNWSALSSAWHGIYGAMILHPQMCSGPPISHWTLVIMPIET